MHTNGKGTRSQYREAQGRKKKITDWTVPNKSESNRNRVKAITKESKKEKKQLKFWYHTDATREIHALVPAIQSVGRSVLVYVGEH